MSDVAGSMEAQVGRLLVFALVVLLIYAHARDSEAALKFIRAWGLGIGAGLSVLAQGVLDMGTLAQIPPLVWLAIGLMFLQFLLPQMRLNRIESSSPNIELVDYTIGVRKIAALQNDLLMPIIASLKFANRPAINTLEARAITVAASIKILPETKEEDAFTKSIIGLWETPHNTALKSSSPIEETDHHVNLSANGVPARLLLALKYRKEKAGYVLSPDSAEYDLWKNPNNEIGPDDRVLRVTISGDNYGPKTFDIPIENKGKDGIINLDINRMKVYKNGRK